MIKLAKQHDTQYGVTPKDKLEWHLQPFNKWFGTAAQLRAYIVERLKRKIQQKQAAKKTKHIADAKKLDWNSRSFSTKDRREGRKQNTNKQANKRHRAQKK